MNLATLLQAACELPEVTGVSVLDLASGVSLGSHGKESQSAEQLAADYARSLNAARQFLEPGAQEDCVQALHIQTKEHSISFLPLDPRRAEGIYLCFLVPTQSVSQQKLLHHLEKIREAYQLTGDLSGESEAASLYAYRV